MNSRNRQKTQGMAKKKPSLSDLEYFDLEMYENPKKGNFLLNYP
jgi:hypothetical protein